MCVVNKCVNLHSVFKIIHCLELHNLCKITHTLFAKLHILCNIKLVSFPSTFKILHSTEIFYTTSGCDGCDKYEVWISAYISDIYRRENISSLQIILLKKYMRSHTKTGQEKYDKDRWGEIQWNHRCPPPHGPSRNPHIRLNNTLYLSTQPLWLAIAVRHENLDFNMIWHFVRVEQTEFKIPMKSS